MNNGKRPELALSYSPATAYPLRTLVSYFKTEAGIVTAIYREWPIDASIPWHVPDHTPCNCDQHRGSCLIQIEGKIPLKDAPLYGVNIYETNDIKNYGSAASVSPSE